MDQMLKKLIGSWAAIVLLAGIVGFVTGNGENGTEVAANDTFLPVTAVTVEKTQSSANETHQALNQVGFVPESKGMVTLDEADRASSNVAKVDINGGVGSHQAFNQVKFERAGAVKLGGALEVEDRPHKAFNTVKYQPSE